MPVDTSRIIPTRRTQKQITEEELRDIELKRLRGELSCAECRRLKLKCDKKVPCGSCVRRGCESICPCGILSAGQGTRFILASTDQLHKKITEMSNRIRQLEDALAILQSSVSDQRHPLLEDELLKIKFGSEALHHDEGKAKNQNGGGDVLKRDEEDGERVAMDALGTLTLDESGDVKYFGRSAGSATLMMANSTGTSSTNPSKILLNPLLESLANLFPFTAKNRPNTDSLEQLESLLPPLDRAQRLCELYVGHATLFFRGVKAEELLGDNGREGLMRSVYETAKRRVEARLSSDSPKSSEDDSDSCPEDLVDNTTPHTLATLFFIFALGALLDLELGAFNSEAELYFDLGRACMSLRTVFDAPSLATVRALGMMGTWCALGEGEGGRERAWCIMSFAAKMAQSIGLHRDSARWNMDPTTVQIRRNLFWEIFASDVSHSLAIGRPPALHLSYVDCEFPLDEEATLSDTGETQNGFWRMKHLFARDIFTSVAEATLGAKSPSYSTILELDRKVREISFPVHFRPYVSRAEGDALFYSSSASLKAFYASIHRTVTMLYLHRSFFAQAMLDHPANPLLSPFASSFLTAYRCASVIIKASAHQFERSAEIGMRVWFLLYHTFSAAVIAGTIVTRSSNSSVAPSALFDLDLAVGLFERAAEKSQRAKIALGVLQKLSEKAHRAYNQYVSQATGKNDTTVYGIFSSQAIDDVEDELAIFGGHTRVLDRKKHKHAHSRSQSHSHSHTHSLSSSTTNSAATSAASSPQPDGGDSGLAKGEVGLGILGEKVHPSLVDYLNSTGSLKVPSQIGEQQMQMQVPREQAQLQQMQLPLEQPTQQQMQITREQPPPPPQPQPQPQQSMKVPYPSRQYPSTMSFGNGQGTSFRNFQEMSPFSSGSPTVSSFGNVPTSVAPAFSRTPSSLGSSSNGMMYPVQQQQQQQSGQGYWQSPTPQVPLNQNQNQFWSDAMQGQQQAQLFDGALWMPQFDVQPITPTATSAAAAGFYTSPSNSNSNSNLNSNSYANEYVNPGVPMGEIVDMGLSTESRLDAGWVSFMRDCGIMEEKGMQ